MISLSLPLDPTLRIVTIIGLGLLGASWLFTFVWTIHDVTKRTKNIIFQCLAGSVSLLFYLPGLLLYLLFRPRNTLEELYFENLEHAALAASLDDELCPKCQSQIASEFAFCAQCGHTLKENCVQCSKLIKKSWKRCPYCNSVQTKQTASEKKSSKKK